MVRYDANSANTNRTVRYLIEPENAADQVTDLFVALKGAASNYPYYQQIVSPTGLQEVAQLRLSLITRVLTAYAPLVGVQVADDTAANTGGAIILTYETDESGVFFNNNWPGNTTLDKHIVTDIVDTVGVGGAPLGPKTKDGLQSLLDNVLPTISYDNGVTGPFGDLSGTSGGTGNLTLPNGTLVTGILPLDNAGGGVGDSGLVATFLRQ